MDFIAIDFETADSGNSAPCSFGYASVSDGYIKACGSFLIDPEIDAFNPFAMRIHKITPDMVAGKPTLPEIWTQIYDLLNNNCVVAHNASFDVGVLQKAAERYHLKMPSFTCYCTMKIARDACHMSNVKLAAVCESFGIRYEHHHVAEADAIACANVMLHYLSSGTDIKCSTKMECLDAETVIDSLDEYEMNCIMWFYQIALSMNVDTTMIRIKKAKTFDINFYYYVLRIGYVRKRHYFAVKQERAYLVPDEIEHDTSGQYVRYYVLPEDIKLLTDYACSTLQERIASWEDYCDMVSDRTIKKRMKEYCINSVGITDIVSGYDAVRSPINANTDMETPAKNNYDAPNEASASPEEISQFAEIAKPEDLAALGDVPELLLHSLDQAIEFENMPDETIVFRTIENGVSMMCESSLLCRILEEGLVQIVQFPNRFVDAIRDRTGIAFLSSRKGPYGSLIIDGCSSMDSCCAALRIALEICLDSRKKEFDCCNTHYIVDGGCCDAKHCISKNKELAMGCGYKTKLRHGIYFTGKNRNV